MRRQFGPVLLTLIFALTACREIPAQDPDAIAAFAAVEDVITRVVEKSERSVVAIARIPLKGNAFDRDPARNLFDLDDRVQTKNPTAPGFKPREFGTGIILTPPRDAPPGTPRRLILTNYHVVQGGQTFRNTGNSAPTARIYVWLGRGQTVAASIFAADPRSDLAVLEFDYESLNLQPAAIPAVPLADLPQVRKGQFVIALGNPYAIASHDGSPSVSIGLVSNVGRFPFAESRRSKDTIHHFGTLLHVDTRLGPGSSGGALLNRNGELIGITTSLAALEGYESSAGFAIPIDRSTRRIVDDLLRGYETGYGFLGVKLRNTRRFGPRDSGSRTRQGRGVEVWQIMPESPADDAGMRSGDLLVQVNGRRLFDEDDLLREVGFLAPGTEVVAQIYRNEATRPVRVRVGKWPVVDHERIVFSHHRYAPWRGLVIDWATSRQRDVNFERPYPKAVLITHVATGSIAERIGIRPGDLVTAVNDRAVQTPDDFLAAVKAAKGAPQLRLLRDDQVFEKSVHR